MAISIASFAVLITFYSNSDKENPLFRHLKAPYFDPQKARLGAILFFEKRLSDTDSIACASCHKPQFSFADNRPLSPGIFNRTGNRNSPAIINNFDDSLFFHDGRAQSLQEQAMGPLSSFVEMGNIHRNILKIKNDLIYQQHFAEIYPDSIQIQNLVDALVHFENSLFFHQSPFDEYIAGNLNALSTEALKGWNLFKGKAKCIKCHHGPDLTDRQFHNIGFFSYDNNQSDLGRFSVTADSSDLGRFKTPSLRNIALTAPYMHQGKVHKLRDVIELYAKANPIDDGDNKSTQLERIFLNDEEKYLLHQFLESLTDINPLLKFVDSLVIQNSLQQFSRESFEWEKLLNEFNYSYPFYRFKMSYSMDTMHHSIDYFTKDDDKIKYVNSAKRKFNKVSQETILLFSKQYYFHRKIIERLIEIGFYSTKKNPDDRITYQNEIDAIEQAVVLNDKLLNEYQSLYQSLCHE